MLNITIVYDIALLVHVGGNAESFICRRAPHFTLVLCLVKYNILQFINEMP